MLTFLKLGGSLITDKTRPYTARPERIEELAAEIAAALRADPELRLVLGHGSGSFGHQAASRFDTRSGVSTPEEWRGFAEVWYQASALNRLVVEALHHAGLPVLTISPCSSITAHDGKVLIWDLYALKTTLAHGLIPVIHGDVVLDDFRGGTILSTEDLFAHLGRLLHPQRVLLAGLEPGVWKQFPARDALITDLTPASLAQDLAAPGKAAGWDVTGGMQAKVTQMLTLVGQENALDVLIFSGETPGNVLKALQGENPGTRLHR